MIHRVPSEDFPIEIWEEMIKVNLTGPFLLSQKVANHMIAEGIKVICLDLTNQYQKELAELFVKACNYLCF